MKKFLFKTKKTLQTEEEQKKSAERLPMQVEQSKQEPTKNVLEIFCPYCSGKNFVKRGTRQKKREKVQLYLCNDCQKTFTPGAVKGKHYPKATILDAISLYNLGYSLERACGIVNKMKTQLLQPSTLANWIEQYKHLCAYSRMREFGMKLYEPENIIESATLAHRQLYRFRYHKAKTRLIIKEDFKHRKFLPIKEFLDLVTVECPHEYFQQGQRASEAPIFFSKSDMIVRSKENYATKLAKFVLESVGENKERHDALQRFMLANDSVTVATEVPVYIRKEDLGHMQTQLGFELYKSAKAESSKSQFPISKEISNIKSQISNKKSEKLELMKIDELPKLITGHIDILQIRNGMIHILDYKPRASKEKPIEQLTLYALSLSRLTGLRVFHFKCAWFDEKDYFEFYPLHLVYKKTKGRRKKIITKEGIYNINQNARRIENLRPAVV